jgi:hypothetical protein
MQCGMLCEDKRSHFNTHDYNMYMLYVKRILQVHQPVTGQTFYSGAEFACTQYDGRIYCRCGDTDTCGCGQQTLC